MNELRYWKARAFATAAHAAVGQKRKYSGLPYIVHPLALSQRLLKLHEEFPEFAEQFPVTEEMVESSSLHDTREDTRKFVDEHGHEVLDKPKHLKAGRKLFLVEGITHDLLVQEFGLVTADYVDGLTEASMPWDGNRAARKLIDRAHLASQPWQVQTVKVVDIKDNLRDILSHDAGFARRYFPEKRDDLEALSKAHPGLLADLKAFIDAYFRDHH